MLHYSESTVFNTDAQTIVNTVNCVGVMGAGVALEFRLRYPEMYEEYAAICERGEYKIGHPRLYRGYMSPWILNFPTKQHWKQPSRLDWIELGLNYFVQNYARAGITSVAFSQLGCGKGGLRWDDVRPVMERYLTPLPIPVHVCLDSDVQARGVEAKMVAVINQANTDTLRGAYDIKPHVAEVITGALPVQRFWHLSTLEGVGTKTYEALFRKIYLEVTDHPSITQLNLFGEPK